MGAKSILKIGAFNHVFEPSELMTAQEEEKEQKRIKMIIDEVL